MKKTSLGTWIVRFLFCVAVIIAFKTLDNFGSILGGVGSIFSILTPFIIGGCIAFFLFPLCRKAEALLRKTKKNFICAHVRGTATLLVIIGILILLTLALWLVVPIIYNSLVQFLVSVPSYLTDITGFIESQFGDQAWAQQAVDTIKNFFSYSSISKIVQQMDVQGYIGSVTNVFVGAFNTLIGSIISIYLLLDRASIKKMLLRIGKVTIKPRATLRAARLLSRISKVIYTFVFGQVLDALLISVCIGLLMTIFRIPNSIILALAYFIFALIPFFGSIIGVICVTLFALVTGNLQTCIIAGVITLVIQQLDSNLINPRIVGHIVGIRPLYVVLGITLFGGLFGLPGLFLGPPLMAILIELVQDVLSARERKLRLSKKSGGNRGLLEQIKESVGGEDGVLDRSDLEDLTDLFDEGRRDQPDPAASGPPQDAQPGGPPDGKTPKKP